jgi:hypothetical protein
MVPPMQPEHRCHHKMCLCLSSTVGVLSAGQSPVHAVFWTSSATLNGHYLTLSSHRDSPEGHTALTLSVRVTKAVSPALLVTVKLTWYSPGVAMDTLQAKAIGTTRAPAEAGRQRLPHTSTCRSMLPSLASSALAPRSHTASSGASAAQRSYTLPAGTSATAGPRRVMLGGEGGAAGAAAEAAMLVLVVPLVVVLPRAGGLPHTPRTVQVSWEVSGSVHVRSPRGQTTRIRRLQGQQGI